MDYDEVRGQLIEKEIHISVPMMDRVSVSTQKIMNILFNV